MDALAKRLFAGESDVEPGPLTPAGGWRLLDGKNLTGALRFSADAAAKAGRYGFFAFRLEGRGVFEGIYNVKPSGKRLLGVFWPDGKLNRGAAAGFLELEAQPGGGAAGSLTFALGGSVEGLKAR